MWEIFHSCRHLAVIPVCCVDLLCLGLTLCDALPAARRLFACDGRILLCCECVAVCLQATNSSTCTVSQQRCFYILTKVHCRLLYCTLYFYGK